MNYLFTITCVFFAISVQAQQANEAVNRGNDLYRKQQYDLAKKEYTDALATQPSNNTIKFNLANTIYKAGNQDEAIKTYDEIAKTENDVELRSKAYYNKGAILSRQKKLEESIEAYKSALRLNPQDKESRENLQKALLELKKKQPPKQKQDQKKQDQKQKQQPPMSRKEAEQRLKMLEQKEKQVQQRLQQEKSKSGVSQPKDW
jgi:Ca-activated chloride channel family protein